MDTDRVVKAFLNIRDARTALKREFDEKDSELKIKQEKLATHLLAFLNDNQIDSAVAKKVGATFYRQEKVVPSCADWNALYEFIRAEDAFDALEKRIKVGFVKEYMETHEGALPPGVNVHREYEVRVRRN
jgi:hypothetical protein